MSIAIAFALYMFGGAAINEASTKVRDGAEDGVYLVASYVLAGFCAGIALFIVGGFH